LEIKNIYDLLTLFYVGQRCFVADTKKSSTPIRPFLSEPKNLHMSPGIKIRIIRTPPANIAPATVPAAKLMALNFGKKEKFGLSNPNPSYAYHHS
jgi:hypothetical protein